MRVASGLPHQSASVYPTAPQSPLMGLFYISLCATPGFCFCAQTITEHEKKSKMYSFPSQVVRSINSVAEITHVDVNMMHANVVNVNDILISD